VSKELFIFAGEMSADLHGEELILTLLKKNPSLKIFGVGGPRMRQTGMESILSMESFQVMGFIDVVAALPKLLRHFFFLRKMILQRKPAAALFIDYADFNMHLESSLKKKGFQGKIIHYISPSVWAWRKQRIKTLAQTLDLLLVIYPFEVECFAGSSLPVHYVGHPLIKRLREYSYKEGLFPFNQTLLALFPGSRRKELVRNFPLMLKTLKKIEPPLLIAISLSQQNFKPLLEKIIQKEGTSHSIIFTASENNYELMRACRAALAKSGTVTLELALHQVPTVVIYKLSIIDKWIAKYLFKISLSFYCIVNLIIKRELFPEFIEHKISEKEVADRLQSFLFCPERREQCKQGCSTIANILTNKEASQDAADNITHLLDLL